MKSMWKRIFKSLLDTEVGLPKAYAVKGPTMTVDNTHVQAHAVGVFQQRPALLLVFVIRRPYKTQARFNTHRPNVRFKLDCVEAYTVICLKIAGCQNDGSVAFGTDVTRRRHDLWPSQSCAQP